MIQISNNEMNIKGPMYLQLYNRVKRDIQNGQLQSNDKLPSIRVLAKELNISRTTIENAYNQLLMEGYIYSKPQSGYYVADIDEHVIGEESKTEISYQNDTDQIEMDYYYDAALFDLKTWKRYLGKSITEYHKHLYTAGHPQGEILLRNEISRYIYKYRGVKCSANQIILGAGIQILLNILCHLLKIKQFRNIAFEDPGFTDPHHIFTNQGFHIKHVGVSQKGIDIEQLKNMDVRLSYVTPSHQFPTGAVMPINSRINLIKWAKKEDGLIIEDDYDSELIYKGQPIPSLQGLDKGDRVIYMGSFSTLFLPAIRISYMVLPMHLINEYHHIQSLYNPTLSKLEQIALALYMGDGEFEKHIRRVKKIFARKNEQLLIAIKEKLNGIVEIMNGDCGVYLIMQLIHSKNVYEIIKKAKEKHIPLKTIGDYRIKKQQHEQIFVLKYRNIPEERINEVVEELAQIIKSSSN